MGECISTILLYRLVSQESFTVYQALSLILLSYKGYLQEAVPSLIDILGGLIKEKANCEVCFLFFGV